MKEFKKLSLNIQFFAEGGNGGDGGNGGTNDNPPAPKTYTEEEYKKLKENFDKASSELANLKKEKKEKLSDDEKRKEEFDELNKKISEYESKFEDFSLREQLNGTFTNEEIDKIISKKASKVDLVKEIATLVKAKVEEAKKVAVQEFLKTSDGGGGQGGNDDEKDKNKKEIEELAKKHNLPKTESKFFK